VVHLRATYRAEPLDGGLFALKGISQNVTEVARSRDAALWGERRARRLVEEAPFAVAVYDLDLKPARGQPEVPGCLQDHGRRGDRQQRCTS
jgi:hypothetical protein